MDRIPVDPTTGFCACNSPPSVNGPLWAYPFFHKIISI
jgi:hypothetical protein